MVKNLRTKMVRKISRQREVAVTESRLAIAAFLKQTDKYRRRIMTIDGYSDGYPFSSINFYGQLMYNIKRMDVPIKVQISPSKNVVYLRRTDI